MKTNSFSINIIFLVLSIIGLALLPKLSLQLRPNHQSQQVHVSYGWGDMSAEVVEKEVTSPLEGVLASVKGVKDVSSESRKGSGRISLLFKKETDMDAARFEVASLIRSTYKKLPEGVGLPTVSYKQGGNDSDPLLMVYNINGEGSNYQLQKYAEENIATQIGQISDVSKVVVSGAMPLQWEIGYDTYKMLAVGLTANDIRKSIGQYLQTRELGGIINEQGQNSFLSFKGQSADTLIWSEIIVGKREGRLIRLTDVTTIQQKEIQPTSYYRINGLNTIYMVIYSAKGSNQVQLSKQVKEKITQLKTSFPNNFSLMLNHDASEEIEKEITKISSRALLAIGILLIFVLLISRRWRYLMIILLSLLANLSIGVFFYYLLGIEIHLYSLAGITVSLGIMIDNTIIMVDHIRHTGNKKAFLAILAATLTTIGSMTVIFFLKEQQRLNLMDFAWVMIINLSVSLFVALWFIPALLDKFPLNAHSAKRKGRSDEGGDQCPVIGNQCSVFSEPVTSNKQQVTSNQLERSDIPPPKVYKGGKPATSYQQLATSNQQPATQRRWYKHKSRSFRWSLRYTKIVSFSKRWRWAFIIVLIWGFGIPTFLIPEEIKIDERKGEQPTWWSDFYNSTLGNQTYVSEVRPWINKILGGSLYYFSSYMDQGNMDWDDQQTRLWVNVSMPDGATLEQMNKVFLDLENYLAKYPEIERFISNVYSIDRSTIEISFTEEAELSSFPYFLKQELETKAVETGGADFAIYGVGQGFNNSLNEGPKSCKIELTGYNYDQLVYYARNLKDSLLQHPRIQEVIVQTGTTWRGKPKYEFVMDLNPNLLVANNSSIQNVFANLSFYSPQDMYAGTYYDHDEAYPIIITKENETTSSLWHFQNNLLVANKDYLRLKNVGSIEKERTGSLIRKKNQQYSINVEYDFIGPYQLSNRVLEQNIDKLEKELPLGYSVKNAKQGYGWWDRKEKTQYWLLFLVVGIIYFICAILLESLVQPLAVIATIPISFIGVFLTFALFKLKFDQGGYASMILLCGITVNSALYIINDYNNNKRARANNQKLNHYIKAYNHKIIPILLTIFSTVLGMVPFLIGGQKEGFWFSLACGSIGGLLFSVLAIVVWLPLFMNLGVTQRISRK